MNDQISLKESIEGVYNAFQQYSIRGNLRGRSCPCCVSDDEVQQLLQTPLNMLSAEQLEEYLRKAVSTFGDVDDFKYFLPRILELMTVPNASLIDDFLTFEKLNYTEWEMWNANESMAIEQYITSLFKSTLFTATGQFEFETVLCLALKYVPTDTILRIWKNHLTETSLRYITIFVWNGCSAMELNNAVRNKMLMWLRQAEVREAITKVYFSTTHPVEQDIISMAYTMIENGVFIETNNYAK